MMGTTRTTDETDATHEAREIDAGGPRRASIERTDYWRRSPARLGGRAGYKEWSYFCVFAPGLDLLLNFSLFDARRADAGRAEAARLALIWHEGTDEWDGDIDEFRSTDVAVVAGRPFARFGANRLNIVDGQYCIDARLKHRPVLVSLTLRPVTAPAVASSVRLSEAGAMRWLVVPRLVANGFIEIRGRRRELHDCLAYHDRNWGHFDWGGDFSWEWASIMPEQPSSPWSIVYMRISDRARHRTRAQAAIVWHDGRPLRTFHDRDVAVRTSGWQRGASALRVPRIMRVASSGNAADLPEALDIDASFGDDTLDARIELGSSARIGVPNDGSTGVTWLAECAGSAVVHGRIAGRDMKFVGRVLAEFNHAG